MACSVPARFRLASFLLPALACSAAPAAAQQAEAWRDLPVTPGTWVYRQDARGSIALFGRAGAEAEMTLRCDRQRRQIFLSRRIPAAATAPATVTLAVHTSSEARNLDALPVGGGEAYVAVALAPGDTLLDAIGYSRGRFAIEGGGVPALVAPPWPEILRVAEDCRG